MMAGTPAYLAPEVARGQEPTPASDVFSLGATLYAAVEGRSPFGTTQNQLAMLHAAAAGYVAPPRQAGSLTSVLTDLLREDPARRPDMAQAISALAAARGSGAALPPSLLSGPAASASDGSPPRTLLDTASPTPTAVARPSATPPRPAPGPTSSGHTSSAEGRRLQRTRLEVALLAVLLALGGIGVVALVDRDSAEDLLPAGQNQPAAPPAAPSPAERSVPPSPAEPSMAPEPAIPEVSDDNPIEYSPAGQLVIDYYTGLDDLDSAWGMLSPRAQASFGDMAAFRAYWGQYSQVSARNAQGVTTNADGSVTVPVDVTYDGRTEQRQLRVTRLDGRLLIDSEAR
jgi:serine/threonine protein kinase